jgi:hypothetical protein
VTEYDPLPRPLLALNRIITDLYAHHRFFDLEEGHALLALLDVAAIAVFVFSYVASLAGQVFQVIRHMLGYAAACYIRMTIGADRSRRSIVAVARIVCKLVVHFLLRVALKARESGLIPMDVSRYTFVFALILHVNAAAVAAGTC